MSEGGIRQWLTCCLGRGELAPLGHGEIEELAKSLGETRYAGGTFVFREGDDSARIHVVRSGRVELSRRSGDERVTQQAMADLLGTRRSSVNRVLKSLETAGVIAVGYGEVDVLDPAALTALGP